MGIYVMMATGLACALGLQHFLGLGLTQPKKERNVWSMIKTTRSCYKTNSRYNVRALKSSATCPNHHCSCSVLHRIGIEKEEEKKGDVTSGLLLLPRLHPSLLVKLELMPCVLVSFLLRALHRIGWLEYFILVIAAFSQTTRRDGTPHGNLQCQPPSCEFSVTVIQTWARLHPGLVGEFNWGSVTAADGNKRARFCELG
jgi:hypothetical protein